MKAKWRRRTKLTGISICALVIIRRRRFLLSLFFYIFIYSNSNSQNQHDGCRRLYHCQLSAKVRSRAYRNSSCARLINVISTIFLTIFQLTRIVLRQTGRTFRQTGRKRGRRRIYRITDAGAPPGRHSRPSATDGACGVRHRAIEWPLQFIYFH